MNDFMEVYDQNNYAPYAQSGETSLHSSCMRHENLLGNLADFYHNFAGAKIIVARDQAGHILGRAIVWENVIHKDEDGKENGRFNLLFSKSGLAQHSKFIRAMIFGTQMRVLATDKMTLDYYIRLTDFYHQFQAIGSNYNQTVRGWEKSIRPTCSTKRTNPLCRKHSCRRSISGDWTT